MSDMPWFQFFASDWLAGTRGLSAVETGIYITLIASMYDKQAPLPNDDERLSRLCGSSPRQFKSTLARLVEDGKILVVGETLWNVKVEEQLQLRAAKSEKAKQSVDVRWKDKIQTNQGQTDTVVSPKYYSNDTNQNQSQKEDGLCSAREVSHETIRQSTDDLEKVLREAAGWQSHPAPNLFVTGQIAELIRNGASIDHDVIPIIRRDAPRCRSPNWNYFVPAIAQARADREAAAKLNPEAKPNAPSYKSRNTLSDSFAIVNAAIAEAERREIEGGFTEHTENAQSVPRLRQITS